MDLDSLKRQLQSHFTDGLVLIVGSGLSCAEGLPGMGQLAAHIRSEVPKSLASDDGAAWFKLEPLLASDGLEGALFKVEISDRLQETISTLTADYVAAAERVVLADVFSGKRSLRLSALIPHLLKTKASLPVVTTNYDRLIEVAFEEAGLGVDSMFVGHFAGKLDETEAALSLLRDVRMISAKAVRKTFRPHAKIAKPHGSLDWYHRDGAPVRCALDLPGSQRLIIAPGKRKFRSGYDSPFDRQRERANRAIDAAARFLIIGYGFNDDHLETHLKPALESGKPALLITRDVTPTAAAIVKGCSNVLAIERRDSDDRSRVFSSTRSDTVELNLWDLGSFVSEVFRT